jgi:REP element-mobilizing transposase RayT
MGRRPRNLVAGGIYHVYNRVSRGQHVFRNDEEADRLEDLFATAKERDDFQILAWCVMSNHYHLAVRMGEVALSRSMRTIHHRFSQSYNGRHRIFGPFWQGRYRARFVDDGDYLRQLIAYIHLNPVSAGVVNDASRYRWCGHREVLGRAVGRRLVDVDETLLAFHPRRKNALAGYRSAISMTLGEEWRSEGPGGLPWWRIGRPQKDDTGPEITVDENRPRILMDGLSNVRARPKMELEEFIELGASACQVELADLSSRKRRATIVEAREILAWLGVELYGFTVKAMATEFEKQREAASRMVSRAAKRRVVDKDFADRVRAVDSSIAKGEGGGAGG